MILSDDPNFTKETFTCKNIIPKKYRITQTFGVTVRFMVLKDTGASVCVWTDSLVVEDTPAAMWIS